MVTTSQPLIISIGEARKIIGKDAQGLTDDQVEELIRVLSSMAEQFLQNSGS